MKKIILLRHAKSSWSNSSLDDHDRPLNKRGKAAAPLIGAWLNRRHHCPDLVLCSSSKRTRDTVEKMREALPTLPEPVVDRTLYHASPEVMWTRLAGLPRNIESVMLVGHQPGLGSLACRLSDGRERHGCRRAFDHFPTGAAAVLEVNISSWDDLADQAARFVDFGIPREIMAD